MLSGAIIIRNEEKMITDAIKSLAFCDEIIVVDDNSNDNSVKIAKQKGALVYTHSRNGNFSGLRNYALEKAKGDWILFIDADEEVSPELANEIIEVIKDDEYAGYMIKRTDIWWGKEIRHGEAGKSALLRLIKKDMGKWSGKVHEVLETHGETGTLKHALLHKPHQTLAEFIQHINDYSTLRAEELYEQKVKSSLFQIITYPSGKFLVNYFLKLGFLDGPQGFVYAFMMSFHSFLVRSKLYLKNDSK